MASYRNTNGTLGGSSFAPRRSSPASIRSSVGGRPRSLGFYSPASSPSPSSSPMSSNYLGLLGLGGYGSSASYHASPSSLSTYGGTASGYGGLTLPLHSGLYHTASSSSIGRSSSPSRSHYSNRTLPLRSSSFNRALTESRVSQLSSAVPRSGSFTSLSTLSRRGSEGYSSGGELSGHSSRLSSVSGGSGDASVSNSNSRSGTPAHSAKDGGENGELDFKKLYEQSLAENDRLREKLKKTEDELHEAKTQLENTSVANVKNSSEMEKRERRAMERKLSEMEEELKQLQKLKAENERLKAENRALTRVVSKLTNSAHATK